MPSKKKPETKRQGAKQIRQTTPSVKLMAALDGVEVLTNILAAKQSTLLSAALENEEDDNPCVDVAMIDGRTLKKVMEFCEVSCQDPFLEEGVQRPIQTSDLTKILSGQSKFYVNYAHCLVGDLDLLASLALMAKYMDVPPLFELVSVVLASMLFGKDADDISTTFRIGHISKEDREKTIKENPWVLPTAA